MNRRPSQSRTGFDSFSPQHTAHFKAAQPGGEFFEPKPRASLGRRLLLALLLMMLIALAVNLAVNQFVRVARVTVPIRRMDSAFEGYTLLQISDLKGATYGSNQALIRFALQNEDFAYICSQSNMKVKFGDPPYERWLKNYNRLLELYPDCIGVKTGFTDDAGRCLVSAAERDGMTLICVTLNAQDDWSLHAFLYDKCFESYSMTPLPDIPSSITLAGDKLQENGIESELMLKPAYEAFVPLKSGESARLTATVLCEPFAYAPAQPGRVYAQTLFSLDGYPLCSVPMIASS